MSLKIVKGMRDIFGEEVSRFQFLEEKARSIFPLYGFEEIRTPLLEMTELFAKGVGEDTDIVGKEMYLLKDRREQSLALRPEGTASVVRSVLNNNALKQSRILKYFYTGPMFRFERPQKGRYRQFHQIGVEYFGVPTADADLECLLLLEQYLKAVELTEVSFELNTIGCQKPECRPAYKKRLLGYLSQKKEELCENCVRRMDANPLRVLDCKVEQCCEVTKNAPAIHETVCTECSEHFEELLGLLDKHGLKYRLNPKLVRGLDYYSKTVFEIYSDNLGAQNAVGGGGRFDYLFEVYGAEAVPSIGFALGTDRLSMLIPQKQKPPADLFVAGDNRAEISLLVAQLRQAGFECHYDPFASSFKSQFRQANRLGVRKVLVLGEQEIERGQVGIKDMKTGEQADVALSQAAAFLKTEFESNLQN